MKKITIILGLLMTLIFSLVGCNTKPKEFYVTSTFLIESFTGEGYDEIKKESVLISDKAAYNKQDFIDQFVTELKNPNFIYNESMTSETIIDKENQIELKVYFDLKEFQVSIKDGNDVKVYPEKIKYYHTLSIAKLNEFIKNDTNRIYLDLESNQIVNDNFFITKDLELALVEGHQIDNELAYLVSESQDLYDQSIGVDVLGTEDLYPSGSNVITIKTKNELLQAINEAVKVFSGTNQVSKEELLTTLHLAFDKARKEVIIGTRIDNNYEVKKNYYEISKNLNEQIASLEKLMTYILIVDLASEAANFFENQKLMIRSQYDSYKNTITEAKRTLINNVLGEDNDLNMTVINELTKSLEKITSALETVGLDIFSGSKVAPKQEYQVLIYVEGVDGYKSEADETLTFSGLAGDVINYQPEKREGFYISSESVLNGHLGEEELILTVKYERKRIFIPINLVGGVNLSYDKSYIEVLHGEKISNEVITSLLAVTKAGDDYHDTYTFINYVDTNNQVVDLSQPILKPVILIANYETSTHLFNYKIETYIDVPLGKTDEPLYPHDPVVTYSDTEVESGKLVVHNFDVPEGFEIDTEKTVSIYSSIGRSDAIKIYLKRIIVPITINLNGGVLDDARLNVNKANIKYGQRFDFIVSGIEKPMTNDGKYEIFDHLVDVNTNSIYQLGQEVTSELNLKVVYRIVEERNKITAQYSHLGQSQMIGDTRFDLLRVSYNAYGEEIKDPAFFYPDTYSEKALFDPVNDIGSIKNLGGSNIPVTYKYPGNINLNETVYNLKFIYRTSTSQAESIMLNEHFKDALLKDTEREVIAKVVGKSQNLYIMEDWTGERFLLFAERGINQDLINRLVVGNELKVTGSFVKNYNEFIDLGTNHLTGRFYEMTLKISNSSTVRTLQNTPTTMTSELVEMLSAENTLKVVDINDLVVLDVNHYAATKVQNYDDGITIDSYYSYKVADKFGNIGYLHMADNNEVIGKKLFLELQKGHTINVKDTLLVNSRVNGEGVISLYDSKYKPYPGLFIDNFTNQIEVLGRTNDLTLNYEFANYLDNSFHPISNFTKTMPFITNQKLGDAIKLIASEEIYNGYELKEVLIDGVVVNPNETILTESQNVTLKFDYATKYFEFYLGTLIPDVLGDDLTLTVTKGGKTYQTKWVDRDENFYKFLITHNGKDPYIKLNVNFNSDHADNYLIIPDYTSQDVIKYVSYESKLYNHILKEFGYEDNHFYELSWGGLTAEKWEDGTKGLFMHAFTTEIDGDSMFADSSLYSFILTENKGIITKDAETYINKDHNMQKNLYNYYDGSLFYMIDGSLTEKEINENTNFSIRPFQSFPKKDIDPDGNEYETYLTQRYYFTKDSLTKFAKFNKFGLGVIFVDLNPTVVIDGIAYPRINKETHSLPYALQDSKLGLERDNSRIFATKEAFFAYQKEHLIPLYNNTDGSKNDQYYARLEKEIKFNILNSDVTFTNGEKSLAISKYFGQTIDQSLLEIANLGTRKVVYINKATNEEINYNFIFDNEEIIEIDILVVEERDVKIRLYSGQIDEVGLAIKDGSNYNTLNFFNGNDLLLGYALFTKQFQTKIRYTNEVVNPLLTNKFVITRDGKDLSNAIGEIVIPFNISNEYQIFHIFEGSKVLIPAKTDQGAVILVTDDNNTNLDGFKLRVVEGTNNYEFTDQYRVYPKTIALLAELPVSNSSVQMILMNGNQGFSQNFGTLLRDGKTLVRSFVTSINTVNTFRDHLPIITPKLEVKYSQGWLTDNQVITITRPRLSQNEPLIIDYNVFPNVSGFEKVFAIKQGTKYVPLDSSVLYIDGNLESIDIKVFYKPIYNPREYVKVTFDLGQYGLIEGLEDVLLDGYMYLKVGEPLVLPNSVTIKPEFEGSAIFKYFTFKGVSFDLSTGVSSGLENLHLIAEYEVTP